MSTASKSRVVLNIWVDDRLEAYKNIFTTEVAQEIYNRAARAETLLKIADFLGLHWRATAYAAQMPLQFVHVGKETLHGFMGGEVADTTLLALARGLLNKIAERVPELVTEPELARKIHDEMVRLGADLRDWRKNTKIEFPSEKVWKEYLSTPEFLFYVWWSERYSFHAAYNAYEDFIVQCVRIANNNPARCWTTSGKFEGWVVGQFGQDIYDECWKAPPVERLREIRHALAHASGRVTEPIRSKKIAVHELDGMILLGPDDVREAIAVLQPYVLKIIDKAVTMPCFA